MSVYCWQTPTLLSASNVGVECISPACCASEVSTEVAVICRLELVSDRAENTMLHKDWRKAKNTLSSNMEGWNTDTHMSSNLFQKTVSSLHVHAAATVKKKQNTKTDKTSFNMTNWSCSNIHKHAECMWKTCDSKPRDIKLKHALDSLPFTGCLK